MINLHIRPANQFDLTQICAIEKNSFSDPWSAKIFSEEMMNKGYNFHRVAVDQETNQVIGYCFYWILPNNELHINNIAVHPSFRRQKIGEQLLFEAEGTAQQKMAHSLTLEVRASNQSAIQFYRKHGFFEEGKRPNYYVKPREDALILRKTLANQ